MDENFLLYRKRALQLLERMRRGDKAWSLYVFSSANTLRLYSMEELVGLGVSWLWMGIEGKDSAYKKLDRADTRGLVAALQANGIRVLGSTIIGLPEHDLGNVDDAIEHAVAHDTEFHQFMLYTPLPGTPLWAEHQGLGTLLSDEECAPADVHGQERFNFRHPSIPPGRETELLLRAFERDFEVNGPSVVRIARTLLQGWQRHRRHPEKRVRARFARECADLATSHAAALWVAERHPSTRPALRERIRGLRREMARELGWRSRWAAALGGPLLRLAVLREEARLRRGETYEPPTFYELNAAAAAIRDPRWREAQVARWVSAEPARGESDEAAGLEPDLAPAG
jgi:hypothetical protein